MTNYPGRRSLLVCWLLLTGLTVVSMVTAMADDGPHGTLPLGGAAVGLILALMVIKMVLILRIYLNLRVAPVVWRGTFASFVAVIALAVWAAHLFSG